MLPVSADLQACLSGPEWAIALSLCEETEEACHPWAQTLRLPTLGPWGPGADSWLFENHLFW